MFFRSPVDWSFSTLHLTEEARHSVTVSTSEPAAIRIVDPGFTEVGSFS